MKQSAELVEQIIQEDLDQKEFDWSHLKQNVRDKLNRFLFNQTKRHPVILPVIMEINQHPKRKNKSKKQTTTPKPKEGGKVKRQSNRPSRGRGKKRKRQETAKQANKK